VSPRLATMARAINDLTRFRAEIVPGYFNTDRKIKGTRLRHPGKGRKGSRLIVRDESGRVVIDHNAAETYRDNGEALTKVERACGLSLEAIMRYPGATVPRWARKPGGGR